MAGQRYTKFLLPRIVAGAPTGVGGGAMIIAFGAACLLGTLSCNGGYCTQGDKPRVFVFVKPDDARAQVTTAGHCTPPQCVSETADGCSGWFFQLETHSQFSACTVRAEAADGTSFTQVVDGSEADECGEIHVHAAL